MLANARVDGLPGHPPLFARRRGSRQGVALDLALQPARLILQAAAWPS